MVNYIKNIGRIIILLCILRVQEKLYLESMLIVEYIAGGLFGGIEG